MRLIILVLMILSAIPLTYAEPCSDSPSGLWKTCIFDYARDNGDIGVCEKFGSDITKNECIAVATATINSHEHCDSLSSYDKKWCLSRYYEARADYANEPVLCEKAIIPPIHEEWHLFDCYKRAGVDLQYYQNNDKYKEFIQEEYGWLLIPVVLSAVLLALYAAIFVLAAKAKRFTWLVWVGFGALMLMILSVAGDVVFPPQGHPAIPFSLLIGFPMFVLCTVASIVLLMTYLRKKDEVVK